ncbi:MULTISPECIES: winged helix-turn-helix transcriptional regulator [Burkholderia]|uniref:Transcriptional regulator n=1 Tax=Burkholderia savannae TaxID=1637837 RepID=A0ABR5TB01_9BURK|nr:MULTISPECIES: helix-turn-helix domain-containing protein [Burkholderia]AOJ67773.1 transcriptional regulator [Burkholderia savannae]AOJ79859.1 transcriptional regulator [Burkholderia savannae]KGR94808.1 hxlR-like helix-turn-helix family protein [Burkholderia sp. ABCPW 111]KVG43641.1 transcriptional regulator [Burkholderia sp. MSMB0265]KVG88803.1 transcriptional regulator [Burkholderia sp. MSMB2040]
MARRRDMSADACPVARAVDAVGDRWSLLIVRDAFDGVRRFTEFQRSLGIARNMLADRLKTLVDTGVLAAAPASDGSAHHEYVLTDKGRALFPVVVALRQWGEARLFAADEPRSRLVERRSGRPVAAMAPRTHGGRVLRPEDAFVDKLGTDDER